MVRTRGQEVNVWKLVAMLVVFIALVGMVVYISPCNSEPQNLVLFKRKGNVEEVIPKEVSRKVERKTSKGTGKCSTDLEEILEQVAKEKTVLWTVVNSGFVDLAENLIRSWELLKLDSYFAVALDQKAAEWLESKGVPCYIRPSENKDDNKLGRDAHKFHEFGTKTYVSIVRSKPEFSLHIAKLGYDQIFSDADIVFLRDPYGFVKSHPDTPGLDYWIQDDISMPCIGFYWMRASPKSIELFEDILKELANKPKQMEQFALKDILNRYKKENRGLKWAYFPRDLFPNGMVFFQLYTPQLEGKQPYIVHGNYIIGKMVKVHRFKEHGMYFTEPDSYYGLGTKDKYLVVKHPADISKTHAKDGLYNAFALAKLLGRILILPKIPCEQIGDIPRAILFCDLTAWCVVNLRPLEYNIENLYTGMKPHIDFRESYLLEHPKFKRYIGNRAVQIDIRNPSDKHEVSGEWKRVDSTHPCGLSAEEVKKSLEPYQNAPLLVFRNLTHRFQGFPSDMVEPLSLGSIDNAFKSSIFHGEKERNGFPTELNPQCRWYANNNLGVST